MRRFFAILILTLGVVHITSAATFNDAATGNWHIGTTWGGGCSGSCTEGTDYPGLSDTVTVDSHTVTLQAHQSAGSVTISTGGTLTAKQFRLNVAGSWLMNGGTFNANTGTILLTSKSSSRLRSKGQSFYNLTINDGLVGYWTFDEGTGTSAADASGYGNDGTLTGGPSWVSNKPTLNFTAPYALDFDGSDDYVTITDNASEPVNNMTLSWWMSVDDVTHTSREFFDKMSSNFDDGWDVQWDNNGLYFYINSGSANAYKTSLGWSNDEWHHVAITKAYTGTYATLYIDGVNVSATQGAAAYQTALDSSAAITLGARPSGAVATGFLDGTLDDVRIYDRALSATEVSALAAGNQPSTNAGGISDENLVNYWALDEGTGTSAADSVGGKTGTLRGNAFFDTDAADVAPLSFTNPSSVYLDGSGDDIYLASAPSVATNFTISLWAESDTTTSQLALWRGAGFALYKNSSNWQIWNGVFNGTKAVVANAWTHLLVTTSGPNRILYVNGVQAGSLSSGVVTSFSCIGAWCSGSSHFGQAFNGHIDDFRIWNRALNASEITALANGNGIAQYVLQDALDVSGSLTLASGKLDTKLSSNFGIAAEGSWLNYGGFFLPRSGTVTLDGTSGTHTLQSGGQAFNNLTVSGTGGTWTLADVLDVTGTYTQSAGTVSTSSNGWNLFAEDWDQTGGTLTANNSTLTLTSSDNETGNFNSGVYDFQLELKFSPDLQGYWKLDEGQGITAADFSTAEVTGTLVNGPRWISSGLPTLTFVNQAALDFDGTDDYVDMGDVTALDVGDTGDLTISGWFNRDTFTTDDVIVGKRAGQAAGDTGWTIYLDDSADDLRFEISDGTDEYQLDSTSTFTSTGWHHFMVVWDQDSAANSEIYIDGVDDNATDTGTIANIGSAENSVSFRLGAESDAGEPFDGKLDDIRVFDVALGSTEAALLGAGKYFPISITDYSYLNTEADLTNYWTFNEGTGTSAADSVGGKTGTLRGNAFFDTDAADVAPLSFTNPSSVYLDGSGDDILLSSDVAVSTSFAISMWAESDVTTSQQALWRGAGMALFKNSSNWQIWNGGFNGTIAVVANTWTHLLVTSSGTDRILYVNGVQGGSLSSGDVTSFRCIGAWCLGTSHFGQAFGGHIDDMRIWDRALTTDEITALAEGGPSSPITFTMNTALDIAGDLTIQSGRMDVSSGNQTITLDGNWANYQGTGSFLSRSATVSLTGGNQTVSGSTAFHNFTKTVTSAATLTFDHVGQQTFSGALTLRGMENELLKIRSTLSGSTAPIALSVAGSQLIDYLDVKDSDASAGQELICLTGCINGGNTINWSFLEATTGLNGFFLFFGF